ncbi:unnamed protein product [Ixodes hexagonus]
MLKSSHICWCYNPRVQKGLLPYDSAHSKTVKRAIASLYLGSALRKSRPHSMHSSFNDQAARLKSAGFPCTVITAVAETLLQKTKLQCSARGALKTIYPLFAFHFVPTVHKVSHNLKNVANRYNVPFVFSAPRKLAGLCPRISWGREKTRGCNKKHARPYVDCSTAVVYEIPLSCGKVYILVKLDVALMTGHVNMNCRPGIKAMHTCQLTVRTVGVRRYFTRSGSWVEAKIPQPENRWKRFI